MNYQYQLWWNVCPNEYDLFSAHLVFKAQQYVGAQEVIEYGRDFIMMILVYFNLNLKSSNRPLYLAGWFERIRSGEGDD